MVRTVTLLLAPTAVMAGAAFWGQSPAPQIGPATAAAGVAECHAFGAWTDGRGVPLRASQALDRLAAADVVLLGERHGTAAHHQWQRDVAAALAQGARPLAIGVEYLARGDQPALDAFVAGAIEEDEFLRRTNWSQDWGFDYSAYRPVFELARTQRIPMIAMNVERTFVRRVAREGFAAAAGAGAPISQPAAPSPGYRARLAASFASHGKAADPAALERFIEAQLTWDRAMAEAIAAARAQTPGLRVVALMGAGHVDYGDGVAHQLADLRVTTVASALPASAQPPCRAQDGAADLFFGLE